MAIYREVAAAKSAALGLAAYDAMMDEQDPGLTTATIDPIFDDLAASLPGFPWKTVERTSPFRT